MLTLRCTRVLLARLRATPSSEASTPSTRLGDWYADAVLAADPVAVFVNERSLLVVLVPLEPTVTLLERWRAHLRRLLESLGVPDAALADELAACESVTIATTANRRMHACLAAAKEQVRRRRSGADAAWLCDHETRLAQTSYSGLQSQPPADRVGELFHLSQHARIAPLH